jgi:uncharacterized protein YndB with AHSA1/START domain
VLKKILIVIVLAVVGLLGYAATRPDTYRVERSTTIEAPPAVVFNQLEDFRLWTAWSPWEKLDPQMKRTYEGPEKGVGASYVWEGNKDVGKGKMTITEAQPPASVGYKLEFIEPFASQAQTTFRLAPQGNATSVTWEMAGNSNYMMKLFGIFMNMDKAIGGDFERGLTNLKLVAEDAAKKEPASAAEPTADAADAGGEAQVPAPPPPPH